MKITSNTDAKNILTKAANKVNSFVDGLVASVEAVFAAPKLSVLA